MHGVSTTRDRSRTTGQTAAKAVDRANDAPIAPLPAPRDAHTEAPSAKPGQLQRGGATCPRISPPTATPGNRPIAATAPARTPARQGIGGGGGVGHGTGTFTISRTTVTVGDAGG